MKTCGLIGNPVEHSLSPVIHNTFSEALFIDADYRLFLITSDLKKNLGRLYEEGVLGLNVTVPYKSDVIPLLDGIDPLAKAIGAVNTLIRTKKGFYGRNTDIEGLKRSFEEEGVTVKGASCLILGAGGAARAAAFMLLNAKAAEIIILNRHIDRAEVIVNDLKAYLETMPESDGYRPGIFAYQTEDWRKLERDDYIAIQCTSVGLRPDSDHTVIEEGGFYNKLSFGYDVIYTPSVTRFMQLCRESGVKCCNGLKMLLYQAVFGYEYWHGIRIPEEAANKAYRKLLSAQQKNIVLIGFMGAGKTVIGERLAKQLGCRFLDTDRLIEEKEGRIIPEIFRTEGEEYFRDLETETVKEVADSDGERFVLSVGGGLVVRECNRGYLKKIGHVVYLEASEEVLSKRLLHGEGRPMLDGDKDDRLHKLLESRKDIYRQTADTVINTDHLTVEEAVLKGERLL